MPSYIELDKQGSFPPSSDISKLIFGVNTNNNATLTDVNGQTTIIGGGGTGLYIPKPIVYASKSVGNFGNHLYNENISNLGDGSGLPGAIQNSWDQSGLQLTYDTMDNTFLNYNPKYFLFVYYGNKKMSRPTLSNPNNRLNSKFGKYFVHPPNYSGGTNISTYKNFSGDENLYFNKYNPFFTDFITEWDVTPGSGKQTTLSGFNPLRYYYSKINNNFGLRAQEFFPIRVDDVIGDLSDNRVSVTTTKTYKRYRTPQTTPIQTYVNPRLNLHINFAIVINDPSNSGRYLIGPVSETVRIYPKSGYFYDDIINNDTYKYFYTWTWKFV